GRAGQGSERGHLERTFWYLVLEATRAVVVEDCARLIEATDVRIHHGNTCAKHRDAGCGGRRGNQRVDDLFSAALLSTDGSQLRAVEENGVGLSGVEPFLERLIRELLGPVEVGVDERSHLL